MKAELQRNFRAAVFLDRDGVVIEEAHYLSDPEKIRMIPGAGAAIARLNQHGLAAILVTNQSGVARGYFSETRVSEIHERLKQYLRQDGAHLDAIYYCPHLATARIDGYKKNCDCRKPKAGMLFAARQDLGLEGLPSFVIGDKEVDIRMGQTADALAILVRTGYGAEKEAELLASPAPPDRVFDSLTEAVDWIVEHPGFRENRS